MSKIIEATFEITFKNPLLASIDKVNATYLIDGSCIKSGKAMDCI
jgi:hypothetical protein